MDFEFAGKNTLLLYVTVCEKVVPRLNNHDEVIEWNFMKITPVPKWRAGCAPARRSGRITVGQPYKTPHSHPRHIDIHPPGMTLPKTAWVRLYRLRTGVRHFRSCLHKWYVASSAACECGADEQTADHVVLQCPIHRPHHGLYGLTVLDDETIEWLFNTCPEIYCGQAVDSISSLKIRSHEWQVWFLLCCLRFYTRQSRTPRKVEDKFAAVREIRDPFIKNCQNVYCPCEHITVDEQLLRFRGRCGFIMYIPNKPAKYRIKIMMACYARSKFMLNAIPYLKNTLRKLHMLKMCVSMQVITTLHASAAVGSKRYGGQGTSKVVPCHYQLHR